MDIKTKFDVGDTVYRLDNVNVAIKAMTVKRIIVSVLEDGKVYTTYAGDGIDTISQENAFASRDAIIEKLRLSRPSVDGERTKG